MKRLLIVYHSHTGNTLSLAQAVAAGAELEPEVQTRLLHAPTAGLDDLLSCDALLLGTPENFGFMSGLIKDFLERTYYPAQGRFELKPYGVFVRADNAGTGAVRQIERIARGYPLKPICEPLIVRGPPQAQDCERAAEFGQTVAAGLAFGIF